MKIKIIMIRMTIIVMLMMISYAVCFDKEVIDNDDNHNNENDDSVL